MLRKSLFVVLLGLSLFISQFSVRPINLNYDFVKDPKFITFCAVAFVASSYAAWDKEINQKVVNFFKSGLRQGECRFLNNDDYEDWLDELEEQKEELENRKS